MNTNRIIPIGLVVAVLVSCGAAFASETAKPVLPWIQDDYPRALAEARARKLPLFIETWAPW